jgi:hypothetical protein
MFGILIVLDKFEKSDIGIWLPFWPDPFLMVWDSLTKGLLYGISCYALGLRKGLRNLFFGAGNLNNTKPL